MKIKKGADKTAPFFIFCLNYCTDWIFCVYYTHVDIVESAPLNVGSAGKYKEVLAHLFAMRISKIRAARHRSNTELRILTDIKQ